MHKHVLYNAKYEAGMSPKFIIIFAPPIAVVIAIYSEFLPIKWVSMGLPDGLCYLLLSVISILWMSGMSWYMFGNSKSVNKLILSGILSLIIGIWSWIILNALFWAIRIAIWTD